MALHDQGHFQDWKLSVLKWKVFPCPYWPCDNWHWFTICEVSA